jgi:hypothetical protein
MYGLEMRIRPTSGLTFRRMPGAILHISTYPFLPPTTMSGWLRRLVMLSAGEENPDEDLYPNTAVNNPDYFALSPDYYVLGAYPMPSSKFYVHTTKRHGPMFQSKHAVFSRLYRNKADEGNDEKLQLHTWEYLLVDYLRGYVLHEDADALEGLRPLQNFGCKIGKEGYAYLETISPVIKLEKRTVKAKPDTLLPGEALIGQPGTLFPLYRYQYQARLQLNTNLADPIPSAIKGFVPFWAGLTNEEMEIDYWTDDSIFLPVALVEALYG